MAIKKIDKKLLHNIRFPGLGNYNRPTEKTKGESVYGFFDGDKCLGLMALRKKGKSIYLYNFIVDPEIRGGGIGGQMMTRLKDKYEGYISFTVAITNTEAIVFYIKNGFKILNINKSKDIIYFYY